MMDKLRSKPTLPRSKKTVEPTSALTMLMMPGDACLHIYFMIVV
jgi:hypothetical protein